MSDWKNTTLNFGKYKDKTYFEVVKKDPRYIMWMYEKGINKPLTSQAISYLERKTISGSESEAMVIALIRSTKKYPCGVLGIKISGSDTNEAFDELHFTCREYLPEQQVWIVPVPILGDILERFPYAMLVGELIDMVSWTPPIKMEKQLNVSKLNNTVLPTPATKKKKAVKIPNVKR
jgi:hypothetical protein